MPRSLCIFRSVDISAVSARELDAFLQMQLREWAPFDHPEHHCIVYGNRALVWVWDGEERRRQAADAGVRPDLVLPESAARTAIRSDADVSVELVRCLEGYEGCGYRGEKQVVSRWWREPPSDVAWAQFSLLMDVDPGAGTPEPSNRALRSLDEVSLRPLVIPFLKAESTLFVVFFACFLALASYQLAGMAHASIALGRAESKIEMLNEAVTPVLSARDEALLALDAIEGIASLQTGPLQLEYLADLLSRLAQARDKGQEVNLMAWEYKQSGVSISVTAPDLSAADLLGLFETVPWLQEQRVDEDSVKGRMRVSAKLAREWNFPSPTAEQVAGS